jgi:hypothetical protein
MLNAPVLQSSKLIIDKNSLYHGLNIRKRQLCVKGILAQAGIPQIEAGWGEAALIGGSVPVDKNAAVVLGQDIPLGDRKNSAFMPTLVT